MVEREITPNLVNLFGQYPFVTVTGPRQSGKTTLCRAAFPHLDCIDLEDLNQRDFAKSDPRRFLNRYSDGAVLREMQHVPELVSYLKVLGDETGKNGLFVLTGSEQFQLSATIGQSLAGRTALLYLLPFSLQEQQLTGSSTNTDDLLYSGFFPRIHDRKLDPRQALGSYFATHVERDLQRIARIDSLEKFRRLVRLCAGRIGHLVNLSNLGSDTGVSRHTINRWLAILEASYVVFRLPPFFAYGCKRLVKTPKLYFYDVGLVSYLLGIEHPTQVSTHPLRGSLFENLVVMEVLKHRFNQGHRNNLYFFRDNHGLECDLLYVRGNNVLAIEIKSGQTIASDWFDSIDRVEKALPQIVRKVIVYGGSERQSRQSCEVVPLSDLREVLFDFEEST